MATDAFNNGDLKFKVELESTGFSMETHEFSFQLRRGSKYVPIDNEMIVERDGGYYLCLTTQMLKPLGTGEVYLIGIAKVPDSDFASGIRNEVCRILLCNLTVA